VCAFVKYKIGQVAQAFLIIRVGHGELLVKGGGSRKEGEV